MMRLRHIHLLFLVTVFPSIYGYVVSPSKGDEIQIGSDEGDDLEDLWYHNHRAQSKNKEFRCPAPYGQFPNPYDCTRYYECKIGLPHTKQCPQGHLYDYVRRKCRGTREAVCKLPDDISEEDRSDVGLDCPNDSGIHAHPIECVKYYECYSKLPFVSRCGSNELFDDIKMKCKNHNLVKCGNRLTPDQMRTSRKPRITTTTTRKITNKRTTTTPTKPTTRKEVTTSRKPRVTITTIRKTTNKRTTTIPTKTTKKVPRSTVPTTTPTAVPTTTSAPTTIPTTTSRPTTIPTTSTTTPIATTTTTVQPNTPPLTNCNDNNADCIMEETKDAYKWFKCFERYAQYPHASSAYLFVHCYNWKPSIKKCAEGTQFHSKYMACVWVGKE